MTVVSLSRVGMTGSIGMRLMGEAHLDMLGLSLYLMILITTSRPHAQAMNLLVGCMRPKMCWHTMQCCRQIQSFSRDKW